MTASFFIFGEPAVSGLHWTPNIISTVHILRGCAAIAKLKLFPRLKKKNMRGIHALSPSALGLVRDTMEIIHYTQKNTPEGRGKRARTFHLFWKEINASILFFSPRPGRYTPFYSDDMGS